MTEYDHRYFQSHVPRCIAEYSAPADDDVRAYVQKEYGERTTVFRIQCPCGESKLNVSAPVELGIVSVSCPACGKQSIVFDPSIHGYDGELGHNENLPSGACDDTACERCGAICLRVHCGFQYCDETDEMTEEDLLRGGENFFGWYVLAGKCPYCGTVALHHDFECA